MAEDLPPRLERDPTNEQAPNYDTTPDHPVVALLVRNGVEKAAAIAQLNDAWKSQHDTEVAQWQNQVARDQATKNAEEEQARLQREEAIARRRMEEAKKYPALPTIVAHKAMPLHVRPTAARFALEKLIKKEFVELDYWSPTGLARAAAGKAPNAPQSRVLTTESEQPEGSDNENIRIVANPATALQLSGIRPDDKLPYATFIKAVPNWLRALEDAHWDPAHIAAFERLFVTILDHPDLAQETKDADAPPDEALVKYFAKTRLHYHSELKRNVEEIWDFSRIDEAQLTKIKSDLEHERSQEQRLAMKAELAARASERSSSRLSFGRGDRYDRPSRRDDRLDSRQDDRETAMTGTTATAPVTNTATYRANRATAPATPTGLIFHRAGLDSRRPPVPYASVGNATTPRPAALHTWPTTPPARPTPYEGPNQASTSAASRGYLSASVSTRQDVGETRASTNTCAPVVAPSTTELRSVLSARRASPLTPLKADAWELLLHSHGLLDKYPTIPVSIRNGFIIGVPPITHTFTPANSRNVHDNYDKLLEIVHAERAKGRYIGPLSLSQVIELLGPFQTSPLDFRPKPHKPHILRLIQNLSYPHSLLNGCISSINSSIDASDYPCTWGTFTAVCLLISMLPPGSQAACRDISEAYRAIPLHPSQWPGVVVRSGEDEYDIDTSAMFGGKACAGVFGHVADAGADIMRARGLGPVLKWVDDHNFFRVLREHLAEFNRCRREVRARIASRGGRRQSGQRAWYEGGRLPDDRLEEFCEDFAFDVLDLSSSSARSPEDRRFSYSFVDIDEISTTLGLLWNLEKDLLFAYITTYIGFVWDLERRTVSLAPSKVAKYIATIDSFLESPLHVLQEVQELYGKLYHASHVVHVGRPYLACLETAMGTAADRPFVPRAPPVGTRADLLWWRERLSRPCLARPIPTPAVVHDICAFSDASSSIGIGIIIGDRWRAWRVLPGWKRRGFDIGWLEALGFEFLVYAALAQRLPGNRIKLWGDNKGVVEGWERGASRNPACNDVFKRILGVLEQCNISVVARYVQSARNPADEPSRGKYPPRALLLPPVPIHQDIAPFVVDFDTPIQPAERLTPQPTAATPRAGASSTTRSSGGTPSRFNQPIAPRFPVAVAPRPYKPHLTPNPSFLRKHCPARERLVEWKPAHQRPARDTAGNILPISAADVERVLEVMPHAYALDTLEVYGSGLLVYHVWCDKRDIGEEARCPASADLVEAFVASCAGAYSRSAVDNHLAGIQAWHLIHRQPWKIDQNRLSHLTKAVDRLGPSKRAPRPPFTVELMTKILSQLDMASHFDVAVKACLLVTFWCTARLGEFTLKKLDDFDKPHKHVRRSHFELRQASGRTTLVFKLPWTKTKSDGEDVYCAPHPEYGVCDPLEAVQVHLALNNPAPDAFLFEYPHPDRKQRNSRRGLTKTAMYARLKTAAVAAGVNLPPGHSARIGSTLWHLLNGTPPDAMKVKGRWATDEAWSKSRVLSFPLHVGTNIPLVVQVGPSSRPEAPRASPFRRAAPNAFSVRIESRIELRATPRTQRDAFPLPAEAAARGLRPPSRSTASHVPLVSMSRLPSRLPHVSICTFYISVRMTVTPPESHLPREERPPSIDDGKRQRAAEEAEMNKARRSRCAPSVCPGLLPATIICVTFGQLPNPPQRRWF
ncbi:unnamed protein product [Peniophora sp. CBMAI 1063]|nr:unnamed protein product [Peniophora sp. CBMAI 1063]